MTAASAIIAQGAIAAVTGGRIVLGDLIGTARTRHTVPAVEGDIGGVLVVRLQYLPNEHEELSDPAVLQRPHDGRSALSFAQPL